MSAATNLPAMAKKPVSWKSVLAFLQTAAWVLFLVTLPVTSFPYFPAAMGGGALVRPLSMYPLFILLLLVTLPRLLTAPMPRTLLPLLAFVVVAVASSGLSLLRDIEPALGITVTERVTRGLFTLAVGCAFYLAVALTPRSEADLRFALRWLYVGFAAALVWGSLQVIYVIKFIPAWYHLLNRIQRYISVRRLMPQRVSGMTYEPNWFAEQISFLLLPWLLASVLSQSTVFPWRWRWVTVELGLLGWAVVVLPFTYSRAGVLNLVVLAFLSILFYGLQMRRKTSQKSTATQKLTRSLLLAVTAVVVLGGLIYVAGTRNVFFARIWGYWYKKNTSLTGYFEYLGFGARFTYGETAFNTYKTYPVMGVGLGNYAFYFEEMLPDRPLAQTPEVLRLITPEEGRNRLITAKNLYFRLLGETGLVGTAAFMAFLVSLTGCALFLWLSPERQEKYWGAAGLLGMVSFFLGALSFDSFAIPNMWIVFGLITAATFVYAQPQSHPPAASS